MVLLSTVEAQTIKELKYIFNFKYDCLAGTKLINVLLRITPTSIYPLREITMAHSSSIPRFIEEHQLIS